MATVAPFLALVFVAGCQGVGPLAEPPQRIGQGIIGGTETDGWPAVGMYAINGGYGGTCTATLVRPDVLLTAGHCADEAGEYEYWSNAAQPWGDGEAEWIHAVEVVMHPQYEVDGSWYAHDLALLLLDEPITEYDYIPVNTTNIDYTWQDKWLHFVGYGSDTYYGGPGGGTKREVDVQIYDYYPETIFTYTEGKSTCSGDSGGPAFAEIDGNLYVAGVVSWGYAIGNNDDSCHGVGAQMRVDYELDFLSEYLDPYETPYLEADDDDDSAVEPSDDDTDEEDDGGCECTTTGHDRPLNRTTTVLLSLMALGLLRRRRPISLAPAVALVPLMLLASCGASGPFDDSISRVGQGIVGGTETAEWPAVGMYSINGAHGGLCTATLIRPDVLLTAGHCADGAGGTEFWSNSAVPGSGGAQEWERVAEVVMHPQYEVGESWYAHDMALLLLDEPITDYDYIPVNTTNVDYTWQDKWLHFVGYGSNTTYGGAGSGTKREVAIQVYDYYPETIFTYTNGKNTCTGDSGGPALVEIDGHWYVAGVVSWVYAMGGSDDSCHGGGAHMRVDYELDFLSEYLDPYEIPYPDTDDDDTSEEVADDDSADEAEGGCECAANGAGARVGLLATALLFLVGQACRRGHRRGLRR